MRPGAESVAARRSSVSQVEFCGWSDALLMTNGKLEVVVVPSVGRVMQLRLPDDKDGVFWTNPGLYGKAPDSRSSEWLNFGGDKTWPAPQGDWEKVTGRAWPPPLAFDSQPVEAKVVADTVTLTSQVDPHYGIRTVRHVRLEPGLPTMVITTEYHKVSGEAVRAGIWIITQVRDPERVFALLPDSSRSGAAFTQLAGPAPKDLKVNGRLLSLARDPGHDVKIATTAAALAWMDARYVLRIDSLPSSGQSASDCRTEVYTNMDPLAYVELELVGPVTTLQAGDHIIQTTRYTLGQRTTKDPEAQAGRVFGLGVPLGEGGLTQTRR